MSWRAKLSHNVRAIGFFFNPELPNSQNVVQYINTHYTDLKILNPSTRILVREAPVPEPYIIGSYDFAEIEERSLTNLSVEQIDGVLKDLVKVGESKPKFAKRRDIVDIKDSDSK